MLVFRHLNHTVDVARLNHITLELHDLGFFEEVILVAVTFKVNVNTLHLDSVHGFFDQMPPGGSKAKQ